MAIWVFRRRRARLRIAPELWQELVTELGRRGRGRGESGAFLLAENDDQRPRVVRAVYYDDLDPHCLDHGDIQLSGFAYSKLWDICGAEDRHVIADVHTHPRDIVRQSPIDREHPMHAQAGHIALILPDFATHPVPTSTVGVHEYLGDDGWRPSFAKDAKRALYIGRWA